MIKNTPIVLIVRDGWGKNPNPKLDKNNAILQADTPVANMLHRDWPTTHIKTCGTKVGLPAGVIGNSEVGHQNIGAGRIVPQELMRLNIASEAGGFKTNPVIQSVFHRGSGGGSVHLIGLVSDGRVHSDIAHLFALIDAAPKNVPIFIHAITDGRDCSPRAGLGFIEALESRIRNTNVTIASVIGRYYAMDRDNRWERIGMAYETLTGQITSHPLKSKMPRMQTAYRAADAIQQYYDNPTEESQSGDEFITPTQITKDDGTPVGLIQDGDGVLFFNYRGDRPRELTKAFVLSNKDWSHVPREPFGRSTTYTNLYFATMTNYESDLPVSAVAFDKPEPMNNILGCVLSKNGIRQFRCAETEKFPHVTYFFNDYKTEPFEGESCLLVPSPTDVSTYDQKPEMSAKNVCQGVLDELAKEDGASVIIVNFANIDMVGHTGKFEAIIKAVEVVDACCGKIIEATQARSGSLIITADHGNAECTWNPETNSPDTAHTKYDVPLHIVGESWKKTTLQTDGILADIAPTMLKMIGVEQPKEMTGHSLL
tara:strand:+ start:476 stop:2095 length:1620 start_codon:yes stop_codon:yes gene_type:complete